VIPRTRFPQTVGKERAVVYRRILQLLYGEVDLKRAKTHETRRDTPDEREGKLTMRAVWLLRVLVCRAVETTWVQDCGFFGPTVSPIARASA